MILERRRAVRRSPGATDPLSRARLRTGPELEVTDISDLGACVRTSARLLPGTHVEVHLMTTGGRVLRRARVARAEVRSVDSAGIAYQIALSFDAPVDSSARWVAATRGDAASSRLTGDHLPPAANPGSGDAPDSGSFQPTPFAALAPDLEKRAGYTLAKESQDVDH